MKKAITHIKIDQTNQRKINRLDQLAITYQKLVQSYITHVFDNDLREAGKYDFIPAVETNLSARWQRCAWQHAVGIMQSFFSNGRESKPILKNLTIQANSNVVVIEPSQTPRFDYWLRISTLTKGKPVRVPIRLYRKAEENLKEGRLCSGVTLGKRNGQWYVTFVVDIPKDKPRSEGRKIGVDIGIVNILTTSDGDHFGQVSDILKRKVDKAFTKRKRKQKLNVCLENKGLPTLSLYDAKLTAFARNEIGHAINQFVATLEPSDIVILENLNIKDMRFKSRRMNRVLSASQLRYVIERLKQTLDYHHIRYQCILAAYSSQECLECGFVSYLSLKFLVYS